MNLDRRLEIRLTEQVRRRKWRPVIRLSLNTQTRLQPNIGDVGIPHRVADQDSYGHYRLALESFGDGAWPVLIGPRIFDFAVVP